MQNDVSYIAGTERTMLTVKQTIDAFRDAEGKPIFSDYMLRRLIRENKIPYVRLGCRKLLLCKESVVKWMEKQEDRNIVQTAAVNKEFGTLRKI